MRTEIWRDCFRRQTNRPPSNMLGNRLLGSERGQKCDCDSGCRIRTSKVVLSVDLT